MIPAKRDFFQYVSPHVLTRKHKMCDFTALLTQGRRDIQENETVGFTCLVTFVPPLIDEIIFRNMGKISFTEITVYERITGKYTSI